MINNKQATILVVDDSHANIQVLAQMLKDQYRVKVATSGKAALAIAESEQAPDLILLDIVMPQPDGYEVCRRLQSQPLTQDIPIIFLTSKDTAADEEYGLSLGAVDYITKPFVPAIVKNRVNTHIQLKQKTDLLKEQALRDHLTGLYNRYYLMDVAPRKIGKAHRHGVPLCVVMVDIDHFKGINDQHGHKAGDEVLRQAARLLARYCRAEDLVCRFGGEEFLLLLDHCDLEAAQEKAEGMRRSLESLMPESIRVTASFGIAELLPDEEFAALFNRADEALYDAKSKGRNHVAISSRDSRA